MEVVDVLNMKGGTGETSYANSSFVQKLVLSTTRTIKEEAIEHMHNSILPTEALCIADLGCSSGPNTFIAMVHLVASINKLCKKLGRQQPEFHLYLNDLPGNDFNNVFRSLKSFKEALKEEMAGEECGDLGHNYFINGVPGSFYGRLFPPQSLHFVHSSYSLNWLSQVPKGLEENKGDIYLVETSPPTVLKAYREQFQRDFSTFLKCRSKEMLTGGFMVLTINGRKNDDLVGEKTRYILESVSRVLRELVAEGLVKEEKLNTFNVPCYNPSASEMEDGVEKEGSFTIHQIEVSEMSCLNEDEKNKDLHIRNGFYDRHVNCIWSVFAPLLASHFGEAIMDELFLRFKETIRARGDLEGILNVNVTVSMMKK